MPTKIRQGKYIDKDGIETDVVFLGAEKAIFDDNNVRLDNKLISMSKASGLTAEDTEGMLGTAEENVNFQLLIDAIAEKVMNELVTNSALTSQLANYVTKAMMSNSQTNDQNKVPTSALAYLMNQQITENENAITQLNGESLPYEVINSELQLDDYDYNCVLCIDNRENTVLVLNIALHSKWVRFQIRTDHSTDGIKVRRLWGNVGWSSWITLS